LQNGVLRAIGKLDRSTSVLELRVACKTPYVYDYITKLFRTQAEVTLNHVNKILLGIAQGGAMHGKYKRVKLGGGQAYDRSAE
jgi:hypothetical protein